MAYPEYFKTKDYITKLTSQYSAITIHMDARFPKIKHQKRINKNAREYFDFIGGNITVSDQQEFEASYVIAQEHQRIKNDPAFDLSVYDTVLISAHTLQKTPSSVVDRYDFVGTSTASINGGAAVVYNTWLRLNRFGNVVYLQMHEPGQVNAKIVSGFLNIGNVVNFMDLVNSDSPSFFLTQQELVVVDELPPIPLPKLVTAVNQPPVALPDVGPTISSGGTSIIPNITGNDSDIDSAIITDSVILINPLNGLETGNVASPLVIAGMGVWSVDSLSNVTFVAEALFNGIASIVYTITDAQGAVSNTASITVQVDATCADFDQGIYSFLQLDDLISNQNYTPIASLAELESIKTLSTAEMGVGTCWHGNYSTISTTKYLLLRNIDMVSSSWMSAIATGNGGVFDGSGLVLDNLTGDTTLFGGAAAINDITIKNLFLTNVNIVNAGNFSGILSNQFRGGNISNVRISGSVSTTGSSASGFMGMDLDLSANANFDDCHFNGNVTSTGASGGIVSSTKTTSSFKLTVSKSSVQGVITGNEHVAGVAGYMISNSEVNKTYVNVNLFATNRRAGLIAGRMNADVNISDCITQGNIDSVNGTVGGIAGVAAVTGPATVATITNCISIPTFSGSLVSRGGLLSSAGTATPIVTDSYWDIDVSGEAASNGGVSKTTAELQTPTTAVGIYVNFDPLVWDFGTNIEYPKLI